MKVKIIKCNDALMWYADKIGEEIEVIRELSDFYIAREDAGYSNIIKKCDSEKIIK